MCALFDLTCLLGLWHVLDVHSHTRIRLLIITAVFILVNYPQCIYVPGFQVIFSVAVMFCLFLLLGFAML